MCDFKGVSAKLRGREERKEKYLIKVELFLLHICKLGLFAVPVGGW